MKGKRKYILEWVERYLRNEGITVLPQYFLGHESEIIKEMGNRGITTEVIETKHIYENKVEYGYSLRRINND